MDTVSKDTQYAALLSVLDSALDAIISIDARGRILTFNPAAERMFGHEADEVIGGPLHQLMTERDADRHDGYVDNYIEGGPAKIIGIGREVECRRKDGSTFPANLTVNESRASGQRIFTGILHDLTGRRAVQARAAALGDIIEHSGSAIVVIAMDRRRIVYANAAARQAWGVDEPLVGRPASAVFAEEGTLRLERAIGDICDGDAAAVDLRLRALRADGVGFTADVHLFGGQFGGESVVVASMYDVSAEEEVALELRRKQLEQTLILRYAPIGIVLLRKDGRIISVNDAAERICGLDESALVGTLGVERLAHGDRPDIRRQFLELVSGQRLYSTSTHGLVRGDGERIPIRTYNAVIRDERLGEPVLISMFEDLSDEYAREAELTSQRERLAHVGRLSQMGEMAAGLAHELNQPLAAISAYTSAARHMLGNDDGHGGRLMDACQRIAQQARRAGDVIRKIRSLATREETRREIVAIDAIIRGLLTLVEIDMRHTGASLELSLDADIDVNADRVQLEQVLLNFVRNAIDACRDLPTARRAITISTQQRGDIVRVEVADKGPGVDARLRARLFDPFVSGKTGGMGMGLSISKTIIEAHGGTIGVDDGRPHGAVFWFALPVAAADHEAA